MAKDVDVQSVEDVTKSFISGDLHDAHKTLHDALATAKKKFTETLESIEDQIDKLDSRNNVELEDLSGDTVDSVEDSEAAALPFTPTEINGNFTLAQRANSLNTLHTSAKTDLSACFNATTLKSHITQLIDNEARLGRQKDQIIASIVSAHQTYHQAVTKAYEAFMQAQMTAVKAADPYSKEHAEAKQKAMRQKTVDQQLNDGAHAADADADGNISTTEDGYQIVTAQNVDPATGQVKTQKTVSFGAARSFMWEDTKVKVLMDLAREIVAEDWKKANLLGSTREKRMLHACLTTLGFKGTITGYSPDAFGQKSKYSNLLAKLKSQQQLAQNTATKGAVLGADIATEAQGEYAYKKATETGDNDAKATALAEAFEGKLDDPNSGTFTAAQLGLVKKLASLTVATYQKLDPIHKAKFLLAYSAAGKTINNDSTIQNQLTAVKGIALNSNPPANETAAKVVKKMTLHFFKRLTPKQQQDNFKDLLPAQQAQLITNADAAAAKAAQLAMLSRCSADEIAKVLSEIPSSDKLLDVVAEIQQAIHHSNMHDPMKQAHRAKLTDAMTSSQLDPTAKGALLAEFQATTAHNGSIQVSLKQLKTIYKALKATAKEDRPQVLQGLTFEQKEAIIKTDRKDIGEDYLLGARKAAIESLSPTEFAKLIKQTWVGKATARDALALVEPATARDVYTNLIAEDITAGDQAAKVGLVLMAALTKGDVKQRKLDFANMMQAAGAAKARVIFAELSHEKQQAVMTLATLPVNIKRNCLAQASVKLELTKWETNGDTRTLTPKLSRSQANIDKLAELINRLPSNQIAELFTNLPPQVKADLAASSKLSKAKKGEILLGAKADTAIQLGDEAEAQLKSDTRPVLQRLQDWHHRRGGYEKVNEEELDEIADDGYQPPEFAA